MQAHEPDAYLAQRVREAVASEVGQLGLQVEASRDLIILRGRLDTEGLRLEVLRTAERVAGGRRVVDETERPNQDDTDRAPLPERIDS